MSTCHVKFPNKIVIKMLRKRIPIGSFSLSCRHYFKHYFQYRKNHVDAFL